jgi:hypothetical protein
MGITHIVIGRHKDGHGWYGIGSTHDEALANASKHARRKSVARIRHRHILFSKAVTNVAVDMFGGITYEWVDGDGDIVLNEVNA